MPEADERFRRWVRGFEDEFLRLEREVNEAWWATNTEASEAHERRLARAEDAFRRFLAQPGHLESLRAMPAEALRDPVLARQHDVARRLLEEHRVDDDLLDRLVPLLVEVEAEYGRFRAELRGRRVADNELKDILRTTRDPGEAREAWQASKQIGPRVADRVRELARIRNEIARRAGYPDWQTFSLTLHELEPARLFPLLDDLARTTEEPFRGVKRELDAELAARFGVRESDLAPWHYGDPFFQTAPPTGGAGLDRFYADRDVVALSRRLFGELGLPVDAILERSDLYEREGKCQHAFCTHIDRAGDVRVLANVRPDEDWMGTMLHELGHAVYDAWIDPALPALLREPAHTLTTEAIAMLFGRLSRDRDFLVRIAGAAPDEADDAAVRARRDLRRSELIFVRWALVVVAFERELYRDPEQDLDARWWELVRRHQLLDVPGGRAAPDWAAKIHVAAAPVYYQNYILGDLLASQLQARLLDEVLGGAPSLVGRPEAGEWLVDRVFRPGARRRWDDLVRDATGGDLEPQAFIREFGQAEGDAGEARRPSGGPPGDAPHGSPEASPGGDGGR